MESQQENVLRDLITLLKGLMISVRVTNPMVMRDPDSAMQDLATICLPFPPDVIGRVIHDFKFCEDPVWPTGNAMLCALEDAARVDHKPIAHSHAQIEGRSVDPNEHLTSKIERAMRSEGGKFALKVGYAKQLILDIQEGVITPEECNNHGYREAKSKAYHERVMLTKKLKDKFNKTSFDRAIISLSERYDSENDYLVKIWS